MEKKKQLVTAPDPDANTLYGIYLLTVGVDDQSRDAFIDFMSTESPERQLFLDEYCNYRFIDKGNITILHYKLKQ